MRRPPYAAVLVALYLCGFVCLEVPRSIVRGINNERFLIKTMLTERGKNLTDTPVNLLNAIPVQAGIALTLELGRSIQRDMRHGVRQVEKKRFFTVALDERDGFFGIAPRQCALICRILDDLFIAH